MAERELASLLAHLQDLTGSDLSGRTFDSRLRIQKAVYFLRELGHPWVHEYTFGDYFHGPYSPALADNYYKLMTKGLPGTRPLRTDLPTGAASLLREAIGRGNRFLETAATLHIFLSRNPKASRAAAVRHLRWIKPQLSRYADEAVSFLEKHRVIPSAT
jgi:uncharacterized protein YwgA